MNKLFGDIARKISDVVGTPIAFLSALSVVFLWAIAGPFLQFSEAWQLTINTGTTIITFLMVFVLQHTQNKDSKALHLKVDDLIKVIEAADDDFIGAEDRTEDEIHALRGTLEERHRSE